MNAKEKEKAFKILNLGLNSAAPDGEWKNCAIMYFSMLRRLEISAEFISILTSKTKSKSQNHIVMPFGKYKGKKISDLPDDYIIWMFENLELKQPLKDAINKEMESRSL